jgi:hypothetical protein
MNTEDIRRYVKVEDEIDMRLRFKNILKMYGSVGLCQVMGEMGACLQICIDVLDEHRNSGNK